MKWVALGIFCFVLALGSVEPTTDGTATSGSQVDRWSCPVTPIESLTDTDGSPFYRGRSGSVEMRGDIGNRFTKILWLVPSEWTDGIHVYVYHLGDELPVYSWHLTQVVRSGGRIGYNTSQAQWEGYKGLPHAGCWQFIVRHGDEIGGVFIIKVE